MKKADKEKLNKAKELVISGLKELGIEIGKPFNLFLYEDEEEEPIIAKVYIDSDFNIIEGDRILEGYNLIHILNGEIHVVYTI